VQDHHLDRKVVRYDGLPKQVNGDAYSQYMRYMEDFRNYYNEHGSESLFYGPKYTDFIPFDFDGDGRVQKQLQKAVFEFVQYIYVQYDVPPNSIRVFYSGSKGYHLLIPSKLFRLRPRYSLERYLKVLALSLVEGFAVADYLDAGLYNTNSLIRLPNSVNHKSNLYKVPILHSQLQYLSVAQIKKMAKSPRSDDWSISLKELTPNNALADLWEEALSANTGLGERDIKKRLKIGVSDGFRHSTAISLAFSMGWRGFDEERIIEELKKWDYLNMPSLNEDAWLEGTAGSVLAKIGDRVPVNEFRLFCQIVRNSPFVDELPDSQLRVIIQLIASTNTRDHEYRGVSVSPTSLIISYKTLGNRSNTTRDVARETVRKLLDEGYITTEITPQRTALILTWQGKFRGLFL
jgi:hypothetical protein